MIDRKNIILIIGVLGIVALIGLVIPSIQYQRTKGSPPPVDTSGTEVKVSYTMNGFEPQTITIPIGTTVAWDNQSGRPMWVGSDPHPSHDNLPGFDQKNIISEYRNGILGVVPVYAHGPAIYEYTFTRPGTWGYHNHLYPSDRGAVIVTDAQK
ncbi:MAG: hypothetical protein AAB870_04815 [Patescibacteria group bacterium]